MNDDNGINEKNRRSAGWFAPQTKREAVSGQKHDAVVRSLTDAMVDRSKKAEAAHYSSILKLVRHFK